MLELQASVEHFPAWKVILWCFYLMITLVLFEWLARQIDDDDQGGGQMIPIFQSEQN